MKSRKKRQKYLAPIYGLKRSLKQEIKLGRGLLLRNTNLLEKESETFEKFGLKGHYIAVLEIDYEYDPGNPSEPPSWYIFKPSKHI